MCHGFWAPRYFCLTVASIPPMQLVMGLGGERPIPGSMSPCRKYVDQLEDTRMWEVSAEIMGSFVSKKGIHCWRWGVIVSIFTSQEDCPGQRGLVCSVSAQRTELGRTWDRLFRMMTNQSSPWGEVMWWQIIYLLLKLEERKEMNLYIPAPHLSSKHFKLFAWNSIWIIMLMEFKLERMKQAFLCIGCSWPWKCLILNPRFCQMVLERADSFLYLFKYLFPKYLSRYLLSTLCVLNIVLIQSKVSEQDNIVPPLVEFIF